MLSYGAPEIQPAHFLEKLERKEDAPAARHAEPDLGDFISFAEPPVVKPLPLATPCSIYVRK